MKVHKEIVWHKGENPKKDGEYLFIRLRRDGSVFYASKLGYTVQHGWNTRPGEYTYSFGQKPGKGAYAWAELPF